jgi:hypothetical protein
MRSSLLKMAIPLALLCIVLVLPTSSHAKSRPDWVDGTSSKYPSPRYFIGVGGVQFDKGGRRQQMEWAGDRARAEIAKTLKANVKVETRAERTVEGTTKGSKARSTGVSKQTDVVSTSAREVLEGVEIKQYYTDKKDRMLYALAVLDRVEASKRLEQRITKTKSDLLAELDEAGRLQKDDRLLPAIGHYQKALALSGEASALEDLMGVLKPTGYRMDPEIAGRATNIRKLIWELRRKIRFTVNVEGPALGVRSYLVQGLTGAGYAVGGKAAGPHAYDLKGTTDLTYKGTINMGKGMDMQIYQADLDLEITDPSSGETLGSLTWSASMNEKTAAMAEKNAVRALGRYVKDTVGERLANLL